MSLFTRTHFRSLWKSPRHPASVILTDIENYNYSGIIQDQAKLDDVSRHSNGGNFLLGDGHAKWFRLGWDTTNLHTTNVYFPPANQFSGSAITDGSGPKVTGCATSGNQPVPGSDMCGFTATFHTN